MLCKPLCSHGYVNAPAIGSMLTFKVATDSATASSVTFQAVTAGAALIAVGIAFAMLQKRCLRMQVKICKKLHRG